MYVCYVMLYIHGESQGSSAGAITTLWPRITNSTILATAMNIFLLHRDQTDSGAHPAPCPREVGLPLKNPELEG